MFELIESRWGEILDILKQEYEITDVSFTTWLKPLKPHSYEEGILTVIVPESMALSFVRKKYYPCLKVTLSEFFDETIDINFILPEEVTDSVKKELPAPPKIVDQSLKARAIEAGLNVNYTFDTFVVGNNNMFAHAAALAVAESPAEVYNPLFIYGGVGLGKTHLMHSIANFILQNNANSKILYVSSEVFTNELIEIIRNQNQEAIAAFRNKYRNIDVLLIDDIQFIAGKDRSQEEFFHTFNTLFLAKKQIILSSDKPPKEIYTLEERLRTRFESGLTVDIQSPDYETRMAILRKKASSEKYDIDDEILQYIAKNIKSNIRELEGALNKVFAYKKLSPAVLNLDMAQSILRDLIHPDGSKEVTVNLIVKTVADHFGIAPSDICGKKKSQDIVFPRQVCMYLCRTMTDTSLQGIGQFLGKRDHTTVIHGVERITSEIETNQITRSTIEVLKKKILPT